MSSKKKSTAIYISEDVWEKLREEAKQEQRSYGFIVEEGLRKRYGLPAHPRPENVNAKS